MILPSNKGPSISKVTMFVFFSLLWNNSNGAFSITANNDGHAAFNFIVFLSLANCA